MAALKTVNASFTITREGIVETFPLPKLAYSRFVTLQVALVGSLTQTIAFGTRSAAQLVEGVPTSDRKTVKGSTDLSISLIADHGQGSSRTVSEWTGLSKDSADGIVFLAKLAFTGATQGDLE